MKTDELKAELKEKQRRYVAEEISAGEYISFLEDRIQESPWIPVGERLPESGFYLTFDTYSESMPIKLNRFNSPYWTMNDSSVTHWMPLPNPPIEKGEG